MTRPRRSIDALLISAIVVLCAVATPAAQVFDPALRFRTLPTEHFIIYFHQGEDRMAQRLSVIAEETWRALQRPLGVTPPPLTHVVLPDQSESANGYATPIPYNTIVIYPVWPGGSEWDFEDWLRLAFTHEFTHIVHLDRSEGWARIARNIFGRAFFAFPNIFLPLWQIEGIATYEESVVTGHGRLHAGDFRAITGEQARARTLEPLDRVNGGLTDWPAGATQYAYGVGFHEYLVNRFGAEKIAELANATARRFPYTSTRAFQYVYGEPLGDLWREYEASLVAAVRPAPADVPLTRLTRQGFWIAGPRFDRFTCAECSPEILYSARNPDGFPALYRLALDGSPPRQVATRYTGSTVGIGRDVVYFDQVERRRNAGFYSDLYALSREDASVRQLTSEARLLDPDLSPDGTTLVCTQARAGQRDLVTVRLKADATYERDVASGFSRTGQNVASGFSRTAITPLVSEPDVYFDAPRWSPDGRTVAVERHRIGTLPEIVLVDAATNAVRVLASDPHMRFTMPTWRPDGAALVVAAAPEEQTFNLVELPIDGSAMRQLTHTTGGALWPDVSPNGKTIVFAGYTTAGYDLFSMQYPQNPSPISPATSSSVDPERVDLQPPSSSVDAERVDLQVPSLPTFGYSPLRTLRPTWWTPVIENDGETIRAGGSIEGTDVLSYHGYAASASWLVASTTEAPRPARAVPNWQFFYTYNRWRPKFYAAVSSATSFSVGPATESGAASDSTLRETSVEGGFILPILHARTFHSALFSIGRSSDDYTLPTESFTRARTPFRAGWQTITAHSYGYSISPERGFGAGATAEAVRSGLGSDGDATTFTADLRGYIPGILPHHVVAVRLSGGASTGDPTVGRTFLLGGSNSADRLVDFSSRSSSLLRGFGDATFAGSRVALVNAEYRFPVLRLQRGFGTWPLFLHTIHASAFVDAGEAWTGTFSADRLKTSLGGELSANIVVGYFAQFTLAAGVGWGHDRSGAFADRATAYFRVGKAF